MGTGRIRRNRERRFVWIVILDPGGLFGAWVDEEIARGYARAAKGILVCLPIVEDYTLLDDTGKWGIPE